MTTSNADSFLICALDVGTTRARICLYEPKICSSGTNRNTNSLCLVFSEDGPVETIVDGERVEIDPGTLWNQVKGLFKAAVTFAHSKNQRISHMGISTQRNTFICWNKATLEPCHNLISWKDPRGRRFCKRINNSCTKKFLNFSGSLLHFFTRLQRFNAAKIFHFVDVMVLPRFMALLETNAEMRELLAKNELTLGLLDTWLILKFTEGRSIVTTHSSASTTGLYDPFVGDWGSLLLRLFSFPATVLPPLADEKGANQPLGTISTAELFSDDENFVDLTKSQGEHPIEIWASLGDSQAACLGAGCLSEEQLKISMGTGAFVDLIVGKSPIASLSKDVYPVVGWNSSSSQKMFLLEAKCNEAASALDWAFSHGLFPSYDCLSRVALEGPKEGVEERGEVERPELFFLPFSMNDGEFYFIGEAEAGNSDDSSNKALKVRALLEGLAFSVVQMCEQVLAYMRDDAETEIRCCGGVSQCDFICQTIADLLRISVHRVAEPQFCSAKGIALAAGINAVLWTEDFVDYCVAVETTFFPTDEESKKALLERKFEAWKMLYEKHQL